MYYLNCELYSLLLFYRFIIKTTVYMLKSNLFLEMRYRVYIRGDIFFNLFS